MEIIETLAKEIFTKTKLPGADYVINQYVGCEHNCAYCYAKFISRWKKRGKWGSWVEVKMNAPELVKNKVISGDIFMSSISDAYQPIEEKLQITRKILRNLDKRNKLSILTKSDLVTRDVDLLKQFKEVEVGLTINSFDGENQRLFEPKAPKNERRIKALQMLHENGIRTYAFVSPLIPGFIDIEDLIAKTKPFVDYYWFEILNLKGAGPEFNRMLSNKFPLSLSVLKNPEERAGFIEEIKRTSRIQEIKVKGFEEH